MLARPPTSVRHRNVCPVIVGALFTLSLSFASGCVGGVGPEGGPGTGAPGTGGAGGDGVGPGIVDFTCNPSAVPPSLPLRRLTRTQLQNTIGELLAFAAPAEAAALSVAIAPALARLPADNRVGPDHLYARFFRMDQAVQQEHIDEVFGLAKEVASLLTISAARLAAVVGACASDTNTANDASCLTMFISRFGERVLRRPLDANDVTFYQRPAGTPPYDAADYGDVIALLLSAPNLVYMVEDGGPTALTASGGRVALTAYELAARLSYQFWQTLPDDALFAAARSGALLTDDGYRAEVDRILADPRSGRAITEFFAQWLENNSLERLDSRVGTPVFDAFAGTFKPGPDLRARMNQEVADSALYYAQNQGSFDDFFTSTKSFAKTDDLATIYGVPIWSTGDPPEFTDAGRVGLLTRAALLATGSANTRPIMKGVFIRKALLCDDIAPPPGNAAANPPPLSPNSSTREVVQALTGSGTCAGCHANLINALGFATENFDALGRARTEQALFDETTGAALGSVPIDTASVPAVDSGDTAMSSGAADLSRLMLQSPKLHACFARQYLRFTLGRLESVSLDGCALSEIKGALDQKQPLSTALRAIALSRSFRERVVE